ncbi:unnamed protein product, partial [Adineta steineri]
HSDGLSLDGASFKQVSFEQSLEVAKFDFMLTFVYNPMPENNRLSFRLTCSRGLFDEITVTNIGRRLEYYFQQLFSTNETINRIDTCFTSISKFGLILPEETHEMEDVIFCRQSHIINEGRNHPIGPDGNSSEVVGILATGFRQEVLAVGNGWILRGPIGSWPFRHPVPFLSESCG